MIKSVKKWWEGKNKPTTPEQRVTNPTNLKTTIDTVKDAQTKKKKIIDEM